MERKADGLCLNEIREHPRHHQCIFHKSHIFIVDEFGAIEEQCRHKSMFKELECNANILVNRRELRLDIGLEIWCLTHEFFRGQCITSDSSSVCVSVSVIVIAIILILFIIYLLFKCEKNIV